MRVKLLILIMLLIACGLQAQKFNFASRRWDTTVLDDSDTIALFHFDEDYSDLSGNAWSLYQDKSYTPKITTGARFGAGYLHDNINIYPQGWYLNASDTSVFDVGTGDYTVEFWMRVEGSYFGTVVGAVHPLFYFEMDGSYLLRVDYYPVSYAPFNQITYLLNYSGDSLSNFALPYAISPGTWHHICFERYAGTVGVYINGVLQATKSGSALGNADLSPTTVRIGRGATDSLIGRFSMDEYRVSKVARHQLTSFTPETKAFGRWRDARLYLADSGRAYISEKLGSIDEYTMSLFHFDSDFTDLATGATWLPSGAWYVMPPGNSNWIIDSDSAKFGDGGIYDNIDTPYNWGVLTSEMPSKFWFGSGDFTLEWWLRVDSITSYVGSVNLLDFFASNDAANYWQFYARIKPLSTSTYTIYAGAATLSNGGWVDYRQSDGSGKSVGDWAHFACVRNSGTMTLYIDGVAVSSFSSATAGYIFNMTNAANISLQRVWNSNRFAGEISIDEFRASNIARYDGNFTPPTEPFGQ